MGAYEYILWISLAILVYTYVGYALLLYLYNNIRKLLKGNPINDVPFEPDVTLIIPAFNEAESIELKIKNSLALNYPADKLKLFFVTDGSSDNSGNILKNYERLVHLHQKDRMGKMAAINRAMKHVETPVVIFSDANSLLNPDSVALIVQHYSNQKIGGVAGEKKVETSTPATLVGEGIYWKYESKMKQLDSDFYTVVGAAGELFSMRTNLFEPQKEDTIVDDFILSMKICLKGFKVIYEPLAFAIETPSVNLKEESKRRIRISAGAFQSMYRLPGLLNIFAHPVLSFQYISRRVLRWAFSPLALIALYISNMILLVNDGNPFLYILFAVQNLAYALAIAGWLKKELRKSLIVFLPFYFLFMNASLVIGFFRFITVGQSAIWEKSERTIL